MAIELSNSKKQPSLFTAVGIGLGCMIGSGWLFAAYYAAKYAGPSAFLSWIIGASLALILALLLAEIATIYKETALFARLLTISHNNRDFGFVIAISNWLGLIIIIPSEASATVQYLSATFPNIEHVFYFNNELTIFGLTAMFILMVLYGLVNFWGIRALAKVNNIITFFKIVIPILTAAILIWTSFNPDNFTKYGFAPMGYDKVVGAVVVCGIFYAFYGFGMVATFGSEIKNPQKNIPIALVLSVVISLVIYLLLQAAFIGALPSEMISKGWQNLDFTSPLAQLLILLNINVWAMILYADAAVSPSGAGILYLGSGTRMLNGMAIDNQMPKFFSKVNPNFNLSRRSLILSLVIACSIPIFFKNWQDIMIVVTVFQLISCVAIPVAFAKLRLTKQDQDKRLFKMPAGSILSFFMFIILSYLLVQAGEKALLWGLILHILFFIIYVFNFYGFNLHKAKLALFSSWSIFAYMTLVYIFGIANDKGLLDNYAGTFIMIAVFIATYISLLQQKDYNK
ncbi:APC family permease [Francisella frigiditurris]|uniref:Amino acid permease family protein n=1 Tax=Francisella frigiditurris TaxID=1542390 RepID=A0A1J0KSS5_9GAMM|nr:APC family permease [Francisella frigiditurris]APC96746.1 amino acid permease family protein [Francisella frigiditurris]